MRRDSNEFDPKKPALLVLYGNTTRKHRPLDGDVIVLGRATACDLSLQSPEVALIHCVIVRVKEGFKVRDCSGRPGTRVNGKPVQEVLLGDGDVIQVGAFSFQAHLPPPPASHEPPPVATPEQLQHLRRSRRKLAERALALRKALATQTRVDETAFARLASERTEVEKQTDLLRTRQREIELRMTRLELSERDLATDRATLDKEYRTLQEDIERHATALRLFHEETKLFEQEQEARRVAAEANGRHLRQESQLHDAAPAVCTMQQPPELAEKARELERRAQELNYFARHLRRVREQLDNSASVPTELITKLRDLLAEAKKAKQRDRNSRRETKSEKSETEVMLEDTGRTEAKAAQCTC